MDHRLLFHPPEVEHPATQEAIRKARQLCLDACGDLETIVPPGEEREKMILALVEACHWALAGIARRHGELNRPSSSTPS
jgi:hypothetical protein